DVDLGADLSRCDLAEKAGEIAQGVRTEIYGRQPDHDDPLGPFGKDIFGSVYRFTFLPWKKQRAVNRGRRCTFGRRWQPRRLHIWRPVCGHESDVLAINRNESTFAQPFEYSLACAQPRLGLFAVWPGIEHNRKQKHILLARLVKGLNTLT